MKKLDYTEVLETCLLSKQVFNTNLPLKDLAPFYIIVELQNKLNLNKAKHLEQARAIIELSINQN